MVTETNTEAMTDEEWAIAHAIAHTLSKEQIKIEPSSDGIVNELKKLIAYLHILNNQNDIGSKISNYLKILVAQSQSIGHSNKTPDYYLSIEKAFRKYLLHYSTDVHSILKILGWSSRLIRYYKVEPIAELPIILPKRHQFQIGDILEAKVIKKNTKGSKVTYEIQGDAYPEKEAKNFSIIPEYGEVNVQIVSLNSDGSINHVKFLKR